MNNKRILKFKDIDAFKNHPFIVIENEEIMLLADSIERNGLLNPLVVREKENKRYEMISGHRRKLAMELNGMDEAECIVLNLNDDEATIMMVDSNIYREKVLPSEKAFAYKMKYEAMKHQGKKETSPQVVAKSKRSDELLGKLNNESKETVRRYIRLTKLIPEILSMVDNMFKGQKKDELRMSFTVAVDISYLTIEEQKLLYNTMTYLWATPSLHQSRNIKKLSEEKLLDFASLEEILSEEKGNQKEKISFNKERIESVLPKSILKKEKKEIEKYIIEAIKEYKNKTK